MNGNARLQRLVCEIDEAFGDYAERQLKTRIEQGCERSLHFFMATKLKHRGYTRNVEVTGKSGGPIMTQAQPLDLSNLLNEELVVLAQFIDRTYQAQPALAGRPPH